MNIEKKYTYLSFLAKREGSSLGELAHEASPKENEYLRLCDCCKMALEDWPRWRVDIHHYLATIDKLLSCLKNRPEEQKKIWSKLVSTRLFNRNPSIFLDTVAEASWSIHFFKTEHEFHLEKRFDSQDPNSKNADILLRLKGKQYWLDVVNVELEPLTSHSFCRRSKDGIIKELALRAIKKYKSKFKKAVLSGPLAGESTGVLLCFSKSEQQVIPAILPYLHEPIVAPPNLFTGDNVGLDLVYAYTLVPSAGDEEYLQPHSYMEWIRPSRNC